MVSAVLDRRVPELIEPQRRRLIMPDPECICIYVAKRVGDNMWRGTVRLADPDCTTTHADTDPDLH
jgi:hypothetical protein